MFYPYFTNLMGLNKDELPLANILDPNIKFVAEAISSYVELFRKRGVIRYMLGSYVISINIYTIRN